MLLLFETQFNLAANIAQTFFSYIVPYLLKDMFADAVWKLPENPLPFVCRYDTKRQAVFLPFHRIDLMSPDPGSLIVQIQVTRQLYRNFYCAFTFPWRGMRNGTQYDILRAVFPGLGSQNNRSRPVFSAFDTARLFFLFPEKIEPDNEARFGLERHGLAGKVIEFRGLFTLIPLLEFRFEVVAQFVRIQCLSGIVLL